MHNKLSSKEPAKLKSTVPSIYTHQLLISINIGTCGNIVHPNPLAFYISHFFLCRSNHPSLDQRLVQVRLVLLVLHLSPNWTSRLWDLDSPELPLLRIGSFLWTELEAPKSQGLVKVPTFHITLLLLGIFHLQQIQQIFVLVMWIFHLHQIWLFWWWFQPIPKRDINPNHWLMTGKHNGLERGSQVWDFRPRGNLWSSPSRILFTSNQMGCPWSIAATPNLNET